MIFFANTILLLKLNNHKKNSKKYYRITIIGFVFSGSLMTPFFLTDPIISDIDDTFSDFQMQGFNILSRQNREGLRRQLKR